jgi:hypothetical protein
LFEQFQKSFRRILPRHLKQIKNDYIDVPFMKKTVIVTTIILLIVAIAVGSLAVSGQVTNEEQSIQDANAAVKQAFNSILDAEKAGGNVTQLLARLNTAGEQLAYAENIYQSNSTFGVTPKANSAKQIADEVNMEAITLKDASLTLTRNSFWFIVTFSVGGAIIFGLIVFLAWQRFRRSYIKKMLSMKPEVAESYAD